MSEFESTFETHKELSICGGMAVFPAADDNATKYHGEKDVTIANKSVNAAVLQVGFKAGALLTAGLCGPGFDVKFKIEGEIEESEVGNDVKAEAENTQVLGGMLIGHVITPDIQLTVKRHAWAGGGPAWLTVLDQNYTAELDIIKTLIEEINNLISRVNEYESLTEVPEEIGPDINKSYQFADSRTNVFGETSSFYFEPRLHLDWNLNTLAPGIKSVMELMKAQGGEFAAGPSLTFDLPVDIKIPRFVFTGGLPLESLDWHENDVEMKYTYIPEHVLLDALDLEVERNFNFKAGWFMKSPVHENAEFSSAHQLQYP